MHGSVSVLLSEVALSCNAAEHHKVVRIAGQNSDLIGLRRDSRSLIYVSQKRGAIPYVCWECVGLVGLLALTRVDESWPMLRWLAYRLSSSVLHRLCSRPPFELPWLSHGQYTVDFEGASLPWPELGQCTGSLLVG